MNLRPYRPADAPATFAVFRAALKGTAAQHYEPNQIDAWLARVGSETDWQARLDAADIALVCEDDLGVFAFATLIVGADGTGEVHQLMCHPRRARQGAAGALLDSLMDEARARGLARLTTQASLAARPVFERHGFSVFEDRTVLGMACYGMDRVL